MATLHLQAMGYMATYTTCPFSFKLLLMHTNWHGYTTIIAITISLMLMSCTIQALSLQEFKTCIQNITVTLKWCAEKDWVGGLQSHSISCATLRPMRVKIYASHLKNIVLVINTICTDWCELWLLEISIPTSY